MTRAVLWRVEFLNNNLDWDWVEVEASCESEALQRGAEVGCVPPHLRPSLRAKRLGQPSD